jgi:hypothetical protein
VQQFRSNYPTVSCPIPTYLGSISYAFLAPALQEALLDSSFALQTRIVPGEADDWCAVYAKENARSIIFTSDTDLVLYEYTPDTLIVFLHDADISAGIKAYSPKEIQKQLQLKSLVPFAYALLEGPQDSSTHLAHKAQTVNQNTQMYNDFASRYTIKLPTPVYLNDATLVEPPQVDVRVSEFIHQALDGLKSPCVYMPLLVEDPNQASAWNVGYDIRKLAYTIMVREESTVVQEFRRKAQGISVQEIQIYPRLFDLTPVEDLERQMRSLKEWATAKSVSPELLWPLFGLSLLLAELNTPPAIPLVQRVLNGDFDNSWAFVHLTARLHAALYSLRMLYQMIRVWEAILARRMVIEDTEDLHSAKMRNILSIIASHMGTLPPIPVALRVSGQAKRVLVGHDELKGLIEEIYTSAGVELPTEHVSNKKKKRQLREAERKKKKAEQRMQAKPPVANTYTLLGNG